MRTNTARKQTRLLPRRSVSTMIRMPADVRARLEKLAEMKDRSVSKMAVMCIEQALPIQEASS